MTTPASNVPTSGGQGGSGGGNPPPASNKDTEAAQGGAETGSAAVPGPAATQPDTTNQAGYTGASPLYVTPPYRAPAPDGGTPAGAITDTTVGGGGIGSTANPAYRAPAGTPPVAGGARETTTQGSAVQVAPGSPDAALIGGGTSVNPAGVDPAIITEDGVGFLAPDSAYNVGGTRDTGSYGSPPLSTVPAAGSPTAPTSVTATLIPGRVAVQVAWTAPANAVATGVVGYVVENSTTGTTQVGKNATSVEFEQGLVPGQTYTFTVYARTSSGNGPRSAASAPVTIPSLTELQADVTRDEGL